MPEFPGDIVPPTQGDLAALRSVFGQAPPVPERHPMQWVELATKTPPIRTWRIDHWLSQGVTLLSGSGGIGKTLVAQQIVTALALGKRYVDNVPAPCKVLMWACEDDHDELWRRQIALCRYFGIPLEELDGKLVIEPRLGRENALFAVSQGLPMWTNLRDELAEQVEDYQAEILVLDNIGQLFAGSENDRHHVTAFVNGLSGLARDRNLSVILLGHPAKAAGSEFSGSTAWENAVRMRWYMGTKLPDEKGGDDSEDEEPTVRYLAKRKTNYSVKDYRKLIYTDGAFRVDAGPGEFTQRYGFPARQDGADACVLNAISRLSEAGIRTTDSRTSPDYLVKRMRAMNLTSDYTPRELQDALGRLRLAGQVVEVVVGRYSNREPKMGLSLSPDAVKREHGT